MIYIPIHKVMKRVKTYPSLKAWRQAVGLNQRDAAKVLGTYQANYAQYELGRIRPRPRLAKIIADKTGVPFERVMGVV